jgi:hypothetical protein
MSNLHAKVGKVAFLGFWVFGGFWVFFEVLGFRVFFEVFEV